MRKVIPKVGGAIHLTLKKLKEVGVASASELQQHVAASIRGVQPQQYLMTTLPRFISEGVIENTAKGLVIGEAGEQLYELLEERAKVPEAAPKPENLVKANLFTGSKDTYFAPELKHVAWRPGAFDYLDCPSVIGGKPVPYFVKRKE